MEKIDDPFPNWLLAFDFKFWAEPSLIGRLATLADKISYTYGGISEELSPTLVNSFNKFPQIRELFHATVKSILQYDSIRVDLLTQLSPDAFEIRESDTPLTRAIASIWRLATGRYDVSEILNILLPILHDEAANPVAPLAGILFRSDIIPLELRIRMLTILIQTCREISNNNTGVFVGALQQALDTRKSGLTDRNIWINELDLPKDSFELLLPLQRLKQVQ